MKVKIIEKLPGILSILLCGSLTGLFLNNLNQNEAEALEGLSYEEKYDLMIEGTSTDQQYNILMGILIFALMIGFYNLIRFGFKALISELSKIRRVE